VAATELPAGMVTAPHKPAVFEALKDGYAVAWNDFGFFVARSCFIFLICYFVLLTAPDVLAILRLERFRRLLALLNVPFAAIIAFHWHRYTLLGETSYEGHYRHLRGLWPSSAHSPWALLHLPLLRLLQACWR
jgi:hypothetical protein